MCRTVLEPPQDLTGKEGDDHGAYLSKKQKRALALAVNRIYREVRDDKKFSILPPRTTNIYFRRQMYHAIDSFPTRWESLLLWLKRKITWCLIGGGV